MLWTEFDGAPSVPSHHVRPPCRGFLHVFPNVMSTSLAIERLGIRAPFTTHVVSVIDFSVELKGIFVLISFDRRMAIHSAANVYFA